MWIFRKNQLIADGIVEIIKWPSNNFINFNDHRTNIYIGMQAKDVHEQLTDFIVREDTRPSKGVGKVVTISAWPQIWRFVLKEKKLASVIVEYGIPSNLKKVFFKIENQIKEIGADSIVCPDNGRMEYPSYFWEYCGHYCCLLVLEEKTSFLRPYADMLYSNIELEGAFIRKPKTRYAILPTIAIIFSNDKKIRDLAIRYLSKDCIKRSKATTFIPPFGS